MFKINPEKEVKKLIAFIRKTVKEQGFERVIIALSGGIDSSTAFYLAVRALGPKNVLVALLPYGEMEKDSLEEAKEMVEGLGIPPKNVFQINIKAIIKTITDAIGHPELVSGSAKRKMTNQVRNDATGLRKINRIRKGNIIARVRMIILYDLAKKQEALVCGTENKSEYLLGYYTRFGDEASDLEPLKNLYKTEVKQLAKYLGVPDQIINQPPSAGLWQGQTDEKELGFSYQQADPILHLYFDQGCSWKEILKKDFNPQVIKKVRKWVKENEFKKKVPFVPQI